MHSTLVAAIPFLLSIPGQVPPPPPTNTTDTAPAPRLVAAQRMIDLGKLVEGDVAHVKWRIENQGNADLIIDRAQASCGCTLVKLSDDEKKIPPGGSMELKADFDSNRRRGEQMKAVSVFTNDLVEPELRLEFKALVESLFELEPPTVINLKMLRRGGVSEDTLKVVPGSASKPVEIISVEMTENDTLVPVVEPYQSPVGPAHQVRFQAKDDAAVGGLRGSVVLKLRVDGEEKQRSVILRGEIISDLTWQPKVIDTTRQPSSRGKGLVPLNVMSPTKRPFHVLGVDAGPILIAAFMPTPRALPETAYDITLNVAEDAPVGPFAATLRVRTDALDQPIIEVPVFGVVLPIVLVEPPLVLFRQDGTPEGTRRRVKLRGDVREALKITKIESDHPAIRVKEEENAIGVPPHVRFLAISLEGKVEGKALETTIRLTTETLGAEEIRIPVSIVTP